LKPIFSVGFTPRNVNPHPSGHDFMPHGENGERLKWLQALADFFVLFWSF
jgi:hypothetical protein